MNDKGLRLRRFPFRMSRCGFSSFLLLIRLFQQAQREASGPRQAASRRWQASSLANFAWNRHRIFGKRLAETTG
jgi:hypothetical protein